MAQRHGRPAFLPGDGPSTDGAVATGLSTRRPPAVIVAAVLSAAYSLGLLWFGFASFAVLFRTGGSGDYMAIRGMVFAGVAGLVGAALLIGGAVRTWRGSFAWTLVPLLPVLALGSIGEVVDLVGTATVRDDLIGAAILVAVALPVGLLFTRSARDFAATRRGAV